MELLEFPNISHITVVAEVGPLSGKDPQLNRCFVDVGGFPDLSPVRERTSEVLLVCVLVCPNCAILVTWALVMPSSVWLIGPEPSLLVGPDPIRL